MIVNGVERLLLRSIISRRLGYDDLAKYYEYGARLLKELDGG